MTAGFIPSEVRLGAHPKTLRLMGTLGTGRPVTVGYLHLFWHWVFVYAPDGFIEKFSAAQIAAAAGWEGDPDLFKKSLAECGLVDEVVIDGREREYVHDWHEHGGKMHHKKAQDAKRQAKSRRNRKAAKAADNQGTLPLPSTEDGAAGDAAGDGQFSERLCGQVYGQFSVPKDVHKTARKVGQKFSDPGENPPPADAAPLVPGGKNAAAAGRTAPSEPGLTDPGETAQLSCHSDVTPQDKKREEKNPKTPLSGRRPDGAGDAAAPRKGTRAYPADFEDVWARFPARPGSNKGSKAKAAAKWAKLTPDEKAACADVVDVYAQSPVVRRGYGQLFITWLNQRMWEVVGDEEPDPHDRRGHERRSRDGSGWTESPTAHLDPNDAF